MSCSCSLRSSRSGGGKGDRKARLEEKACQGRRSSLHGDFADGTKFDSSRDRGTPMKSKLRQGQVIKGWDQGIITMKKGKNAIFTVPPELAYGE
ncbi:hypothetical protein MRB53_011079 [Persea americana]|uniref:Uncharacterized protein n=1 Tax=Persea americana TaxID=3435 RepID=A0ACC2LUJ9_PERAE|nr:hypothetical protein MRB53_011079 [Persea americana]